MAIKPQTHFLTSLEILELKSLDFRFQAIGISPEVFINTHFTNCDLLLFLKQIDAILSPLGLSSINKFIHVNNSALPELYIQYFTDNYDDENNGLALSRIFFGRTGN